MTGKKILDAKQQGKCWLEMEGKVHPVMHLGINYGWIKFKNDDTVTVQTRG